MPELPEVETIARQLQARLPHQVVTGIELSGKPLRMNRPVDRRAIEQAVIGAAFVRVWRRGKYLMLELSSAQVLLVHLGMSGRLEVVPAANPRRPHTHCVFRLSAGPELRFVDPRRFGLVTVYPRAALASAPELASLGPDPLDPAFTAELLHAELRATKGASIKAFLLDQRQVAGVGNIYASEALFEARIHPRRPARSLSRARATRLHAALRAILGAAVENRGTTFRDYVDSWGGSGTNQDRLRVFMRAGAACPRCRGAVRRIVQNARSTFLCGRCQT